MGAAWACFALKQNNDTESFKEVKYSHQSDESNKVQQFKSKFEEEKRIVTSKK